MDTNTDDVSNAMKQDISHLQQEVVRLQKLISAQGAEAYYEVRERAGKAYEQALPKAKDAVRQIRDEGAAAATAAGEHVAATTTALVLAGAIGFVFGYMLAGNDRKSSASSYWWR